MTSTVKNKMLLILVLSVLTIRTGVYAQNYDQGSIVTNHFRDNWEVSFGVEHFSFYSSAESSLALSKSPFNAIRSNFGATASVGKWFSPELGLRTKANGYWGKRILGDDIQANRIKFYYIQEQVMLNLSNLIAGYSDSRLYNAIPFGGFGFVRDCTHNDNSIGASVGVSNSFRISSQFRIHLDVSAGFAGNTKEDPNSLFNKYKWFGAELGLTFKLGKTTWDRSVATRDMPVFVYDEYTTLTDRKRASGVTERVKVEGEDIPTGMVLIPRGHVRMGIEDNDTLWGRKTPVRDVSVDDFWMDCTEVTNRQYKEFVNYVLDSVITQKMNAANSEEERQRIRESFYTLNPVTGKYILDFKDLNYKYEVYDYTQEALRKNRLNPKDRITNTDIMPDMEEVVLISKDTAYVDAWGGIHRESITRPLSGPYDFLNTYIVNIFPDTTCWVNDFPNADNEMYLRYYWTRSEYDDYPVVGVTWEQANAYCAWRTEMMRRENGYDTLEQPFRLPTEAEWEYAARGRYQNDFPWAKEFKGKGCFFANYMADEGDLTKDGNIITSRVAVYDPNSNGLYDMAGNVAEWTSTAYSEAGVEIMNVINPQLKYDAAPDDPYQMKRKTVKGGSWKDPESHVRSAWRTAEYQNQPRSYIGFRCVRSLATKASEKAVAAPSRQTKKSRKEK